MRITFNLNGGLLKAPKLSSKLAFQMGQQGWAFIRVTKSGSGIWFKEDDLSANLFDTPRPVAYALSDRAIAHSSLDFPHLHKFITKSSSGFLDELGISGQGDFSERMNARQERSGRFIPPKTDITAYTTDLDHAQSWLDMRYATKKSDLKVLKAYLG